MSNPLILKNPLGKYKILVLGTNLLKQYSEFFCNVKPESMGI